MPQVESSIIVKKISRDKCYDFVKNNVIRFPEFIADIKELRLIRKLPPDRIITDWTIDLGGAFVKWKEEDIYNDKDFSVSFCMLEGDFSKYEGKWQFEDIGDETKICISALFEWGIPNLGKYVGPVLEKKAKLSFKSMLLAIKKELKKENFK